MAQLIYEGRTYTRNNSKWVDRDCFVVNETLQRILNKLYEQTLDFSQYSLSDLITEGDKFKASYTYDTASMFYEKAISRSMRTPCAAADGHTSVLTVKPTQTSDSFS